MNLLEWMFGCCHDSYTWPQGRGANCHVTCTRCGKTFSYDFDAMKIVEPASPRLQKEEVCA